MRNTVLEVYMTTSGGVLKDSLSIRSDDEGTAHCSV